MILASQQDKAHFHKKIPHRTPFKLLRINNKLKHRALLDNSI